MYGGGFGGYGGYGGYGGGDFEGLGLLMLHQQRKQEEEERERARRRAAQAERERQEEQERRSRRLEEENERLRSQKLEQERREREREEELRRHEEKIRELKKELKKEKEHSGSSSSKSSSSGGGSSSYKSKGGSSSSSSGRGSSSSYKSKGGSSSSSSGRGSSSSYKSKGSSSSGSNEIRNTGSGETYVLGKEIGSGAFGVVYEGKQKSNTRKVAVKLLKIKSVGEINDALTEGTMAMSLNHPNVVTVYDCFLKDSEEFCVVMKLCNGSLTDWIRRRPSESQRKKVTLDFLRGLEYLHKKNIMHRDLKPDNVFMEGDEPRIGDFGLSKALTKSYFKTICGTSIFMAPELDPRRPDKFTKAVDVWAAGLMVIQILALLEMEDLWIDVNLPCIASMKNRRQFEEFVRRNVSRYRCEGTVLRMLAHKPGDRLGARGAKDKLKMDFGM